MDTEMEAFGHHAERAAAAQTEMPRIHRRVALQLG